MKVSVSIWEKENNKNVNSVHFLWTTVTAVFFFKKMGEMMRKDNSRSRGNSSGRYTHTRDSGHEKQNDSCRLRALQRN